MITIKGSTKDKDERHYRVTDDDWTIPDFLRRKAGQVSSGNFLPSMVKEVDENERRLSRLNPEARKLFEEAMSQCRARIHWLDDPELVDHWNEKPNSKFKEILDNKFKARMGRAQQRSSYVPGAIWDTKTSRWIHPSLPQKTVSDIINSRKGDDMPNAEGKTVPMLTEEYNALCNSPAGKAVGLRQIVKFRDLASATKRVKEAREKVYAVGQNGGSEAKRPKEEGPKRRLEFSHPHAKIVEDFDFRYGSEREKLLHVLLENFESFVAKKKLGKLAASLSGIEWRIDNKKIPYALREEEKDGEASYGLFRKVHP